MMNGAESSRSTDRRRENDAAARHAFQDVTKFTIGQRIDEEMDRMIDDEQKIRHEEQNGEDQHRDFATRIAVDQTDDGEN